MDASSRRKILLEQFQCFLDNIEESRKTCPEESKLQAVICDPPSYQPSRERIAAKLSKHVDYMDQSNRPLITNVQVQEYRPTARKEMLRLKEPIITNVEFCKIPDDQPRKAFAPPPGVVENILANPEMGYPPPGEKSPYLYRSPKPVPLEPSPRYPPPPQMDHLAGMPCLVCEPPIQQQHEHFKAVIPTQVQSCAAESADPSEPPVCRKYFVPQPPCVAYYNNPCGVHERQLPCCQKLYNKLCSFHRPK